MRVAALYVDPRGVYAGLPDVEVWDEARDARKYAGPWPVVAHPPCARWSRLAGFTEARFGYKRGEDGGCFEAALRAVREFGGVLEHPAHTAAWAKFDLPKPQWHGGWTSSLTDAGSSCYVEQGRYGDSAKKATWLYACGVDLPELLWGFLPDNDEEGPRGMDYWNGGKHSHDGATPVTFRDVLLDMARTAGKVTA